MNRMHELKEMLCRELDEISGKGEIKAGDLETVHKLTDTIKNINKIEMLEGEGYSQDGGWRAEGSYSRDRMYSRDGYEHGNSYARHYVRGHYSRGDGREELASRIEDMMQSGELSGSERTIMKKALEALR